MCQLFHLFLLMRNCPFHLNVQKAMACPGWCSSVGWSIVLYTLKGHQFDSSSGHMPSCRLTPQQARIWETTNQCFSLTLMFLSLSLFLPSLLSKANNHRIKNGLCGLYSEHKENKCSINPTPPNPESLHKWVSRKMKKEEESSMRWWGQTEGSSQRNHDRSCGDQ